METLLKRVRKILVRLIGDHAECPRCHHAFIPDSPARREAIELLKLSEERR